MPPSKKADADKPATGLRVLGRIRLSRETVESTSAERQREIIGQWASANNHVIVGWAEDLDVSGSVDPFDTPSLGPWLREPKIHEWDILCAWKLDRISRRAIPMNKIFGLCQPPAKNECAECFSKTLVCVSDNIDLSTWVGRMIANVIAGVAEGELEAIRERTRESQKKLRETGRWGGGKVFYGYRPAEREEAAGWELVPDEHAHQVLVEIIEKVLDGRSTESIARDLNEAGELSPMDYQRKRSGKPIKGSQWSNAHLRQQLRSKALLGHMTHQGATVRDEAGSPVLKGPPLIDQDKFDRLQAALDKRSFQVSHRSTNASPLLGVAICGVKLHKPDCAVVLPNVCDCGVCGKPLHLRQHRRNDLVYRYYQCVGGPDGHRKTHADANIVKADELEDECERTFLTYYGHENIKEKVHIPAADHQAELDEAVQAAQEISLMLGTATSTTMRKLYQGQLEAIDRRIAELEKLPTSPARWEWREQDQTYAEVWGSADADERRQLLIKRKVRAEAVAPKEGRYRSEASVHMYTLDVDLDELEARAADERAKWGVPE